MKIAKWIESSGDNIRLLPILICDECGEVNPPTVNNTRETCCLPKHSNGMYHGKTMKMWIRIRNPFFIQ